MTSPNPRPWRYGALLAAGVALAAAAPAGAEPLTLRLDPQASHVRFELDALAHTIHGSLAVERGEVRFDAEAGTASGEIVVDARSAKTSNGSRDRKMHETVLESARFPRIVFSPTRVSGAFRREGRSDLQLAGTIALHGASHPVVLAAQVEVHGGVVKARAPLTVPFVEWGLEDPSNLLLRVAKQVQVAIEAQGALE
jgi:polyisoprenoid-binding protein YceI